MCNTATIRYFDRMNTVYWPHQYGTATFIIFLTPYGRNTVFCMVGKLANKVNGCVVAAAIFHLFSVCCNAQVNSSTDASQHILLYQDLFRVPHWELVFHPNVTAKAELTHLPDAKYQLTTSPQLSHEFGIQRVTHLQPRLSLAVGLRFGLVGRNSAFTVPSEEIGYDFGEYPFSGPIARQRDVTYFSIPAQLEYRVFLSKKRFIPVHTGLSLRFAPLNGSSNGDMDVMEVKLEGNKKPFVNINLGAGYAFVLRNMDVLKLTVNGNYDPSYIAKGTFYLETNSSYDAGSYKVTGSSIGLSLTYCRTRIKEQKLR